MTREEAIDILVRLPLLRMCTRDTIDKVSDALNMAIEALEQRPHGEWIEKDGYDGDVYYDCSVCGNSWCTFDGTPWQNGMNFCPNCGADMREGDSDA